MIISCITARNFLPHHRHLEARILHFLDEQMETRHSMTEHYRTAKSLLNCQKIFRVKRTESFDSLARYANCLK